MASNNASLTKTLLWTVPVALLLGLVLIAVNAANPTPSTTVPAGVAGANGATLGAENAKVTMEVFEDFQCPHCRDLALNVEPTIIKEYVQTGKVKLVYRHFIVIGPDSAVAGQAAECAAKQNQFWPYHDKLFSVQGVRTAYTADSLKKYATDLGLNTSAFNTCLDTGETQFKVRNDSEEGAGRGVRSTPTAFINGQMVVGTQEIDAYRKIINAALQ